MAGNVAGNADVSGRLGALGEQLNAAAVVMVPADESTPSAAWFARPLADDEMEVCLLAAAARAWAAALPGSPEQTVCSVATRVQGWQVIYLPLVGLQQTAGLAAAATLVVGRGPRRVWTDAERAAIEFAGRLGTTLAGFAVAGGPTDPPPGRDRLTGLPDRAAFLETCACATDSAADLAWASYVVELHCLPAVNEVLGLAVGDRVITTAAARITAWAGRRAVVGRTGGAQFAVCVPGVPEAGAARREGKRLASLLTMPVDLGGSSVERSVTVGVAWGATALLPPAEVLARAFDALQTARRSGGNSVWMHDGSAAAGIPARSQLELELRDAVTAGDLRMYYQPEVDLRSGVVTAVEALLRWQHPRRGLLGPDEFIDVAEGTPAILDIGRWVIDTSLAQLRAWQRRFARPDLMLRLNLSASQLVSDDIVELVRRGLARHRVRGEQLCVELTERAVPHDLDQVATVLQRLRELGVTAAIDDFGTGQSTLTQLLVLPVDAIKIDRGFVTGMMKDPRAQAIVAALVGLAAACGLGLIAEGVEAPEEAAELLRLGCYRAQGHLLGRSVPPEQMATMLAGSAAELSR